MSKHEYIKKIEGNECLSVLKVGQFNIPENTFDNKNNYVLMYTDSNYIDNQIVFSEKIIRTKHGFLIHLTKFGQLIDMKVYYKPEQTNELIIYIKQFLKQI